MKLQIRDIYRNNYIFNERLTTLNMKVRQSLFRTHWVMTISFNGYNVKLNYTHGSDLSEAIDNITKLQLLLTNHEVEWIKVAYDCQELSITVDDSTFYSYSEGQSFLRKKDN